MKPRHCQWVIVFWMLFIFRASASVLYVDLNSTNPTPPYADWATAATNIQDAVDAANSGDQILVTNGVYQIGGRLTGDGTTNRVAVTNAVTLQSVNGPTMTLINGGHTMRCVYLTDGAVLAGFTLTNGYTGYGGGVWCSSTNALVSNCLLINNLASWGGGVYSGTLNNCTLTGNVCPMTGCSGGGAYGSTLNNCTLSGNVTGRTYPNTTGGTSGGGAAGCILNNCTLSGNSAYGAGANGGGASGSTLNNCMLINNTSSSGGGAYGGTLNNCVFSGNYASVGGGACSSTLNNCTVSGYNDSAGGNTGAGTYYCTANNCVIYYNVGVNNTGSTLNYCCTPDAGNVGCITNAPLFVNQAGGDYHLQTYSPCINAGNNAYVTTTNDLDGNPRIVGGTVDCGAYENQSATAAGGLPSIPSSLNAVVQGGSAALNWPASFKATGYNVYRASASAGSYTKIASGVSATNYNDTTIVNGGTFFYFVTAINVYGESVGSPQAIVYFVDHFAFAPIGMQTSSVPFAVTISACDLNGNVLSNFTGAAILSAAGDHGNVPLTPATTAAFLNGQWAGTVTLDSAYPDTNIRLTASSNSVSGTSNPFNAVAPAIQVFNNLLVVDLVYNPFTRLIYATVPANANTYSNCLIAIDPVMGRIVNSYYIGNDPGKLALSGDGHSLYIGFYGTNVFGRFNLTSNVVEFLASVGMDNYYGLAYHVNQFAVLPGQPHSVAIGVNTGFGDASQVLIFDDDIERSNILGGLYSYSGTVVAASDTRLYAGTPFTRMTVDQTGVLSSDGHDGLIGLSDLIKYQGGLVFTPGGTVFNPETLAVYGTLTNCSILEPDLAAGRIYSMGSHPVWGQSDAWRIYAWNATNLQLVGSLDIPYVSGGPSTLVRWGTNGIAFGAPSWYINQFFLVRTPLVPSVPPILTRGSRQASGPFQLNFTGDQNIPYTVWASTNLASWTPLGPANLMSNGWFWFWDVNATNYSHRFYRAGISQ